MSSLPKKDQIKGKMLGQHSSNDLLPRTSSKYQQNENNQGLWSALEQEKYIIFLELHRKIFHSKQKRKETRIFKKMSEFMKTRNCIQCRSHHMKQLKVHKERIRNIISSYISGIDKQQFLSKVEEMKQTLGELPIKEKEMQGVQAVESVESNKVSSVREQEDEGVEEQVEQSILPKPGQIHQLQENAQNEPPREFPVFWLLFFYPH